MTLTPLTMILMMTGDHIKELVAEFVLVTLPVVWNGIRHFLFRFVFVM